MEARCEIKSSVDIEQRAVIAANDYFIIGCNGFTPDLHH